ncbi:hypothetical protein [Sphingomicrobium sediminis]|uniref:DUF4760 domain-containing protein n=1 Tax=Sphingomicrobium sediminis TaxID=2950949 RepID=A0A9X2EKD0_9SPHN|nr:hypothetical protein [Sphingomicrobium sediminis]MCM8558436.1 hypothetical protein [Sphingomicrobium sediminis]
MMLGETELALILPLLTLGIGYLFGARRDAAKLNKEKRTQAYLDFLNLGAWTGRPEVHAIFKKFAEQTPLPSHEQQIFTELETKYSDLNGRLLLYGSPGFLKKLVTYYDDFPGGWIAEGGEDAYAALVAEMRKDSTSRSYRGYRDHVKSIHLSGVQRRRDKLQDQVKSGELKIP